MTELTIVEVGPRDGLQNEAGSIPTDTKLRLIDGLGRAGLKVIEATSFVHPRWVPQLADADRVLEDLNRRPGVRYPVLTPNVRGLRRAVLAGAREVAVFVAASDAFNRRNINRSTAESVAIAADVVAEARVQGLRVRAYVSTVCGCPYQGVVPVEDVVALTGQMFELGVDEVSLGDTIGVGTPWQVQDLLESLTPRFGVDRVAVHMHDTYGQGLANSIAAIEAGVRIVDTAVGGLGGCPYAPGSSGNLATEDLVHALKDSPFEVGVDLDELVRITAWMSAALDRAPTSRVAQARLAACDRPAGVGAEGQR